MKAIRASKKYTQEVLAEKMEINSKFLSSIERGNANPTLNIFIKFAEILEVPIGDIFHLVESEDPEKSKKIIIDSLGKATNEQLRIISKVVDSII